MLAQMEAEYDGLFAQQNWRLDSRALLLGIVYMMLLVQASSDGRLSCLRRWKRSMMSGALAEWGAGRLSNVAGESFLNSLLHLQAGICSAADTIYLNTTSLILGYIFICSSFQRKGNSSAHQCKFPPSV